MQQAEALYHENRARKFIKNKLAFYDITTLLDFGKYRDETVGDILESDPDYIYWLFTEEFNLSQAVLRTLLDSSVWYYNKQNLYLAID